MHTRNGKFFNRKSNLLFLYLAVICWIIAGCDEINRKKYDSPPGYDMNEPIIVKLPTELDEISGVAYYPKDTSVFAITDEVGWLYKIFLNRTNQIQKWQFSDVGDYEDLVLLDSNFYVLKSVGDVTAFRFMAGDTLALQTYPSTLGSGNEFEILYFDDHFKKLMMICKDCESDKKKHLSSFSFDPWSLQFDNNAFVIDVTRIAAMAGETKMKFKPSAATINPITGDVFIISAINKILVVADRQGNAKQVYRVDPGMFKQPEGICFMTDGTMIISNEFADVGVANLLIFPYNPKAQATK
ncbi:MAG: hypothetical protein EOP49_04435 [Sphingobacteriales bacterium]|nr:MAG: hypothetical protein EOP49_04435 [Sphingobacteriales bacterium]